ncbi:MAG: NADPH:quinone reductase-like Zn-dependent oxidoreductase [Planctomycetota bacterium]|jgi:NADPH:quinone reductase-like Zn-dependent oxidoreductase
MNAMKACTIAEHGGPEVLKFTDRPIPEPSGNEVRVSIKAAGMNHLDCWVRRGVEGHQFPLPIIPGCDGAGVVESVGADVVKVKVGDRVAIAPGFSCGVCDLCVAGRNNLCRYFGVLGETTDGTNAEFICVPEVNALAMPDSMSFVEAAAAPLVFLTAWHMVVNRCQIRSGDQVLVHAAGSGVSMAAIQIAKFMGAEVLITAGSDEKVRRGLELGADHGINYRTEDFLKVSRDITKRRGLDIVVDHVGAENIGKSIRALAKGGRVVTCGATAGPKLETDLRLVFFKSLSILGSTMGGHGDMRDVWRLICTGALAPVVGEVLPLTDVAKGHALLENRAVFGKVVLTS